MKLFCYVAGCMVLAALPRAYGGGVTLITHGFSGNVTDWIIPMAQKIPLYPAFPGTNYSCYEISITRNAQGQYVASPKLISGVAPGASDSGEIIIKLDWSTLSSGSDSTTTIANAAASALLATNLIAALGGHPLTELPMHFAGHSRGGSVITELARLLGAQGIWIDQVTTLDPHPVSQFGDPSIKNYANVLFADNYWQNMGDGLFVPNGQAVPGAYNRYLTNLNGGYSSSHSDVHLWYHGTIELSTPASDTQASITSAERLAWWLPIEAAGTNAGMKYSLIGGGNRLSNLEPAGPGTGRIIDGFNNIWNLGAGVGSNRTLLPANNGLWPNLLRLIASTNALTAGESINLTSYYQYGSNTLPSAALQFYLDSDPNPYNGNEILIYSGTVQGTGTNNIGTASLSVTPDPVSTPPGNYFLYGRISDGAHSRYLYLAQAITIQSSRQASSLAGARIQNGQFEFTLAGIPGQRVAIQVSSNLVQWANLQTNTLATPTLEIMDPLGPDGARRFYRAQLLP